jgi:hypothetical protein
MLNTPYSLPYAVWVQPGLAQGTHDVSVRVVMAAAATPADVRALHATVLPFLLTVEVGAWAGPAIPPWQSTAEGWSDPWIDVTAIEWTLRSVTCDPRAWVALAQMLLIDHARHPIAQIAFSDAQHPDELVEVQQGRSHLNPYPPHWSGVEFAVDLETELYDDFTVCVSFVRPLSDDEEERVREALFGWAPGLIHGAWAVAPVPPDSCTGLPDPDPLFVDNEVEWIIRHFRAHTGAIEGLVNVVAALSHDVVRVTGFRIE